MCADDDDDGACDVGEHSDVWGIGCLMYHMITGVPIHDSFRHEPRHRIPNKVPVVCIYVKTFFTFLRHIFTLLTFLKIFFQRFYDKTLGQMQLIIVL